MIVLAFVPDPDSAKCVVEWSNALKHDEDHIEYVCFEKDGGRATETALREVLDGVHSKPELSISTSSPAPVTFLLERCRKTKPRILVAPTFSVDFEGGRPQNSDELIRYATCRVASPLFSNRSPSDVKKILMIVSRGTADATALRMADHLRKKLPAKVTLATVEYDSGPKAERAGEKAIRSLVHDLGLDEDQFEVKVVVDRLRHRGILTCCENHELIICGRDVAKDIRPLSQSLGETTSLIVKRAPPLRLKSLADWLPRINPNDHADLLQDLRQGSRWNTDFISMLALASAIASLGLMQNSPAVVIGSMLLAPMMTPMIGAGLAIAQANTRLASQCSKTILFGFLLTLAVSFLLGFVTPSRATLSPEVISRGGPNVLDLLIALFAAIAATIAMARPGIAGAVAGVAIATALVPPICAIGLSLSLFNFGNALGALVLFGTNLIAIIVASSFTFSVLGIVTVRSLPRHRRLIGFVKWGLVFLLAIIAGPLSFMLLSQLHEGRTQTAVFPVTRAVAKAVENHVTAEKGVDVTFIGRPSTEKGVLIYLSSDHPIPRSYANKLRDIVRDEMQDPELPVVINCFNGQWYSDSDAPPNEQE